MPFFLYFPGLILGGIFYFFIRDSQPAKARSFGKGMLWSLAVIPATALVVITLLTTLGGPVKTEFKVPQQPPVDSPATAVVPSATSQSEIPPVSPPEPPQTVVTASEVNFAKDLLQGLINGDPSVGNLIDWPSLKFMGEDLGKPYRETADEAAKAQMRSQFFEEGRSSFQSANATLQSFTNWRVFSQDSGGVTVACDGPKGGSFFFVIFQNKLISMQGTL